MKIKRLLVTAAGAFVMACLVWLVLDRMRVRPPDPPPPENLPQALVVYCFHTNSGRQVREDRETDARGAGKVICRRVERRQDGMAGGELRGAGERHFADEYHVTTTSIVVVDGRPGDRARRPITNRRPGRWPRTRRRSKILSRRD